MRLFLYGFVCFATCYAVIIANLVQTGTDSGTRLYLEFVDKYSGPLIILPLVWLIAHAADEVLDNVKSN